MLLTVLQNQNDKQLVQEVQNISKIKNEDELFEIIGNALYYRAVEISPNNFLEAAIPISIDEKSLKFNVLKSINFVEDTTLLTKDEAKKKGRGVFKRIINEFCSNESFKKKFTGDGDLKDNLKIIIPTILGLISSTLTLESIGLAIAVTIIALLLKVEYKSYCEIQKFQITMSVLGFRWMTCVWTLKDTVSVSLMQFRKLNKIAS